MKSIFKHPLVKIVGVCLGLCLAGWVWGQSFFFMVAAGLISVSVLSPRLRDIFLKGFEAFGAFMGSVQRALVLGIVFYGVLWPLSWIYKLGRKRPDETKSTFVSRDKTIEPADFIHLW